MPPRCDRQSRPMRHRPCKSNFKRQEEEEEEEEERIEQERNPLNYIRSGVPRPQVSQAQGLEYFLEHCRPSAFKVL